MQPFNPVLDKRQATHPGGSYTYYNRRKDNIKNFVLPPVEFKNKPLETENLVERFELGAVMHTFRHTYGNNLCLFPQGPCNDGTTLSGTIFNWLTMSAYKDEKQIYDRIIEDPSLQANLGSVFYKEVVYPRSTNVGLAQTRGRTQYAETALWLYGDYGNAVLSNGSNGIDRGVLERRTFWRNETKNRNRDAASYGSAEYLVQAVTGNAGDCSTYTYLGTTLFVWSPANRGTTLPNSQGHRDGCAASIWAFGSDPVFWDWGMSLRTGSLNCFSYAFSHGALWAGGYSTDSGSLTSPPDGFYTGSNIIGGQKSQFDFDDTGELNSANYQTIAGYAGSSPKSGNPGGRNWAAARYPTLYPTASAYYYHRAHIDATPWVRDFGALPSDGHGGFVASWYVNGTVPPHKWQTSTISDKKPIFDSYKEYASDMRGIGKNLTIIPEFRMSEHIAHYENTKRKQNDQFLTLDGANITASADTPIQADYRQRGFTEKFFNDYSNSDFQKYFGKFNSDSVTSMAGNRHIWQQDRISLKCNVVKKLLPYMGFYPQQRTLQLASLFSQSIAPYIGGISWSAGETTDFFNPAPPSGALAVQSLIQPYFAPGILYNTIKSGIAVDWAAYTGSQAIITPDNSTGSLGVIPNYRIPFGSLLDPLDNIGIPPMTASDDADRKMMLLYPTYQTGSNQRGLGGATVPIMGAEGRDAVYVPGVSWEGTRRPWCEIDGVSRNNAKSDLNYMLYKLAMSNFLAEIPNFYLRNNRLTRFVSKRAGDIHLTEGHNYYIDVVIAQDSDIIMFQDYYNENPHRQELTGGFDRGLDGSSFGPPVRAGSVEDWSGPNSRGNIAPAYAPYTPSHFYGESRLTLKYVANADDVNNFSWNNFFDRVTGSGGGMTYKNTILSGAFAGITGSTFASTHSPAKSGQMHPTASLDLFGLAIRTQDVLSPTGDILQQWDNQDSTRNSWVISTKMETPVLNFSTSVNREEVIFNAYTGSYHKGMWLGYGEIPQGNKGLHLRLQKTPQQEYLADPSVPGPSSHNDFFNLAFEDGSGANFFDKKLGEINPDGKEIGEAIVAIPYLKTSNWAERGTTLGDAFTTENQFLDGRYFISLREAVGAPNSTLGPNYIFDSIKQNIESGKPAITQELADELGPDTGVRQTTSISEMIDKMNRYIIPPELDFNMFSSNRQVRNRTETDPGLERRIEPFIMYIFEFTHELDKTDLADIWQGLMPEISRNQEMDSDEITYDKARGELWGTRKMPEGLRWMIFKVKRKAENDYFKMTPNTLDDFGLKINSTFAMNKEISHSYNWPYDYFSLVELAELEVGTKFKK